MAEARQFLALAGFRNTVFVGGVSGLRAALQSATAVMAGVTDRIGVPADFASLYGRIGLEFRFDGGGLLRCRGAYDVRRRMIILEGPADQFVFAYAFSQALDHMLGDLLHGVSHSAISSPLLSAALPRYLGSGYRHERLNLLAPGILRVRFEGLPALKNGYRPYGEFCKKEGDLAYEWVRSVVALRWRAREDGWVVRTQAFEEALRTEGRQNPEWAAPQNMMARAFAAWAAPKTGEAFQGLKVGPVTSDGSHGNGIDRRTLRIMEALRPILRAAALEWRERVETRMAVIEDDEVNQGLAMAPGGVA
ncbi:MAG: hypothetical protein M0Z44_06395 [Gammaproteobacteria bacterium]|nr:hypothetical protein [Gammaproteobacteria bacterium]MDA8361607.1 hypothetical protein [Gammaproteobacteria bacterium]